MQRLPILLVAEHIGVFVHRSFHEQEALGRQRMLVQHTPELRRHHAVFAAMHHQHRRAHLRDARGRVKALRDQPIDRQPAPAYRLQFETEEAANAAREALKGESDVASVENNYEFPRPTEEAAAANGTRPSLNLKPKPLSDSDRLIVGVLDTPFQAKAAGLQDFLLNPPTDEADGDTPTHGTTTFMLQAVSWTKYRQRALVSFPGKN